MYENNNVYDLKFEATLYKILSSLQRKLSKVSIASITETNLTSVRGVLGCDAV